MLMCTRLTAVIVSFSLLKFLNVLLTLRGVQGHASTRFGREQASLLASNFILALSRYWL